MLNWLKKHLLSKYIKENKTERKKQLVSLKQAKSIGILCRITDENSYKSIFSVFSSLQTEGHSVRLVGYIDDKSKPYFCLDQLTADYFCNKDLNWYGKPIMVQVNDFIAMDFDILIDFSNENTEAIKMILNLSSAKFIAGGNRNHRDFYDLFIDNDNSDDDTLLQEINTYTQQLTGN